MSLHLELNSSNCKCSFYYSFILLFINRWFGYINFIINDKQRIIIS